MEYSVQWTLLCTDLFLLITSYSVMNKLIRNMQLEQQHSQKKQSQKSWIFNLMYPISLNSWRSCSFIKLGLICFSCTLMKHVKGFACGFQTASASLINMPGLSKSGPRPHLKTLKFSWPQRGGELRGKPLTSTKRWGEIPLCSTARWYNTGEDTVTFQHKAGLTAVSDLVPDVVPRAVTDPVWNETRGATCVAGQHWKKSGKTEKNVTITEGKTTRENGFFCSVSSIPRCWGEALNNLVQIHE